MDFDRLSDVWRRAGGESEAPMTQKELAVIQARALAFDRKIRLRNTVESVAAAIVVVSFGRTTLVASLPLLTRVGAGVMVLAGLFIPYWMWRVHKPRPASDLPVAALLAEELKRVRTQIHLLRTVAWWYLGPLAFGGILFTVGMALAPIWGKLAPATALVARIAYVFMFPVVYAGVWWVNQHVVKTHLIPREKEIEAQLAALAGS
jgi:hypothetical protein